MPDYHIIHKRLSQTWDHYSPRHGSLWGSSHWVAQALLPSGRTHYTWKVVFLLPSIKLSDKVHLCGGVLCILPAALHVWPNVYLKTA